jgi:hypothetical protein
MEAKKKRPSYHRWVSLCAAQPTVLPSRALQSGEMAAASAEGFSPVIQPSQQSGFPRPRFSDGLGLIPRSILQPVEKATFFAEFILNEANVL